MSYKFTKLILITLVVFVTSCSNDVSEIDVSSEILGTWERVTVNNNETTNYRLVFSDTTNGLEIHSVTNQENMIVSNATEFTWDYDGNATITINNTLYTLVTNGDMLQLEDGVETPIIKISDQFLY
ncbi:hypothetical protein [Winogradskyella sp.]|uniref:hypothetical protein n=1 Tax=Winogradskyella sp. TaxID=1883156 RepID=UPI0025F0BA22|nr:hypothetical protein [Winogradskyella sp.]